MSKLNSGLLFRSYVWLADAIYSAGHITREEIDRKWSQDTTLNHHNESRIPERTFHNWKAAIQDMFGINIECDRSRGRSYYIANADEMEKDGIRAWMLNTFSVNNLISDSHDLKQQILFEQIPSGQRFLTPIIEAMRDKVVLQMTYHGFGKNHATTFNVKPYCVKVYRQRWYMLGKSDLSHPLIYALDRIEHLEKTEDHYRLPANFDAEAFFAPFVGVSAVDSKREYVTVKVDRQQANYLRTLPIHESQRETERNEDYSIFRYFLVINYEFIQELRTHGAALKVLEPQWLANQMKDESEQITALYNE